MHISNSKIRIINNMTVYEKISDFLKKEGIEYFNALPFSECEVINERKLRDFKPESCIAFLIPYYTGEYPERNISLYSVSRDYHLFAKELEERLLDFLKDPKFFPEIVIVLPIFSFPD